MAKAVQIKYYTSGGKLIKKMDYNKQLFVWIRELQKKGCKKVFVKFPSGLEKIFILNL